MVAMEIESHMISLQDPHWFFKRASRSMVNREIMTLYGHDQTGFLPALPQCSRQQSSLAQAWSCENQAVRQLGNLTRRGPRCRALNSCTCHKEAALVNVELRRPHTAVEQRVIVALNARLPANRPETAPGLLEKVAFTSQAMESTDQQIGRAVVPHVPLKMPTKTLIGRRLLRKRPRAITFVEGGNRKSFDSGSAQSSEESITQSSQESSPMTSCEPTPRSDPETKSTTDHIKDCQQ